MKRVDNLGWANSLLLKAIMCGLAGIFSFLGGAIDIDELVAMRDNMVNRGPDDAGLFVSEDLCVGLAHRRLSIIDTSSAGRQPMESPDGRYQVVFNGEIYNYRELRSGLEAEGVCFRTGSDTEVLIHMYARHGARMLPELRGMFAFAIWDGARRGVFLATDPFGIKPLYVAKTEGQLRFASQVKALALSPAVDCSPDPAGHVGFLLLGSVPEPHTMYRGIKPLGAGCSLWVDDSGTWQHAKWVDLPKELAEFSSVGLQLGEVERESLIRDALRDSVASHLIADVPVAVFQSAGLDSSTITGLCSDVATDPVHTLTVAFREFQNSDRDEAPLAQAVASHYQTDHKTIYVTGAEFRDDLDRLMAAMDQPTIDGVNVYLVSKAAASVGAKVALSGLGGDELFGGYPSFHQIPKLVRTVKRIPGRKVLGPMLRVVSTAAFRRALLPKAAGAIEFGGSYASAYLLRRGLFMPWELTDVLEPDMAREGLRSLNLVNSLAKTVEGNECPFTSISALEAAWYMKNQLLRDADWAGMAHSLEIRVPFVDVALWRRLAAIQSGPSPYTKREMARSPGKPLPEAILNRPKTGFEVPIRSWLSEGKTQLSREPSLRSWARTVYYEYLLSRPTPVSTRCAQQAAVERAAHKLRA